MRSNAVRIQLHLKHDKDITSWEIGVDAQRTMDDGQRSTIARQTTDAPKIKLSLSQIFYNTKTAEQNKNSYMISVYADKFSHAKLSQSI